ncbi:MAG TPA: nicotinamide-nucleotide amidohydrolase family protein, partial [Candidatus Kapabacteria bacterium]
EQGATLAFLPKTSGIRLRISARAETEAKAKGIIGRVEKKILAKASQYIYGSNNDTLEDLVVGLLKEKKRSISVAESCTGGMLSMRITNVPGSSKVYPGSIISYADDVKIDELNVLPSVVKKHGAVSEECVVVMAEGVLKKFSTTYALAISGTAGPDGGTKAKPVGTVWIALAEKGKPTIAKRYNFGDGRSIVRERSCDAALEMLRQKLI